MTPQRTLRFQLGSKRPHGCLPHAPPAAGRHADKVGSERARASQHIQCAARIAAHHLQCCAALRRKNTRRAARSACLCATPACWSAVRMILSLGDIPLPSMHLLHMDMRRRSCILNGWPKHCCIMRDSTPFQRRTACHGRHYAPCAPGTRCAWNDVVCVSTPAAAASAKSRSASDACSVLCSPASGSRTCMPRCANPIRDGGSMMCAKMAVSKSTPDDFQGARAAGHPASACCLWMPF